MSRLLIDLRMADGSRHFGGLPESYDAARPEWDRLRDAVPRLPGARLTSFVTDGVTEAWIDFELGGHAFALNNQQGSWWFFVGDPDCPDELLATVLDHFENALCPHAALARRAGSVAPGGFRVLVYEGGSKTSTRDFVSLSEAKGYADDAAWESENGVVHAVVLDDSLRVVAVGERAGLTGAS